MTDIFRPLIPVQAVGLLFVFGTAWMLGRREERRLGWKPRAGEDAHAREALLVASILFAAGAFTGIMKESGMLADLDLGAHQRFSFPFLFAASILMTITCVAIGVFPL